MAQNAATKQKSSLDKSIDLGLDQFGRFLKSSWIGSQLDSYSSFSSHP